MQNKVLGGLVVGVLLVGGFFFYWQKQNVRESTAETNLKTETKKVTAEKEPVKKVETKAAESVTIDESKIIYYYGAECPHCKDVLAYLDENDIYNKLDFVKKEVWHDKKNGEELVQAALKCGLDPSKIGVPFLFSAGKCYMGGPDVMKFFGEKAGIKK